MFEREILKEMRQWKMSEQHKPLVLRGARQVGKTTVVNEFSKEFSTFLSFNLDREEDRALFDRVLPFGDFVNTLFAMKQKRLDASPALIFIDEIQNSPRAISLLRYFKEERPDLYVISAGSLLENVVDLSASFPVGRVEYMALRPCSFLEFISALGQENMSYFIDNPESSIAVHESMMSLFNQYVIVGGMPEAVSKYADNHDIMVLNGIYETLLLGYKDDVEKYVKNGKLNDIVKFLIEKCWAFAGQTVKLGGFGDSDYRAKEVGEAFRLLQKAMLLELVYPTTSTSVPALGEMKRMPKLVMLDTGLTNYSAGIRRDLIGATDILDVWRGHIAEQAVAQELLTLNNKVSQKRCFWVKGRDEAEVDFVWTYNSRLFPIEVKNGRNSHLRSLHSFIEAAPIKTGVRVWSGPFSVDDVQTVLKKKPFRLINLPFYLVGNLEKILDKYSLD